VKRGARIQRIAWTSGPCVQPLLPPSPGLRKRIAATQDGGTRRGTEAGTTRHPCVQAQSPRSTCPGRRETLATRSARGNRHRSRPGLAGRGDHSHLVRPAGDRSPARSACPMPLWGAGLSRLLPFARSRDEGIDASSLVGCASCPGLMRSSGLTALQQQRDCFHVHVQGYVGSGQEGVVVDAEDCVGASGHSMALALPCW
jgi:hypothetical protein